MAKYLTLTGLTTFLNKLKTLIDQAKSPSTEPSVVVNGKTLNYSYLRTHMSEIFVFKSGGESVVHESLHRGRHLDGHARKHRLHLGLRHGRRVHPVHWVARLRKRPQNRDKRMTGTEKKPHQGKSHEAPTQTSPRASPHPTSPRGGDWRG